MSDETTPQKAGPHAPPSHTGLTSITVLEFLNGLPLDKVAEGYLHALRPSTVRVSTGEVTCDCRPWRVTVLVDRAGKIQQITQEVEVELFPQHLEYRGHPCGHAHNVLLRDAIRKRDAKEVAK